MNQFIIGMAMIAILGVLPSTYGNSISLFKRLVQKISVSMAAHYGITGCGVFKAGIQDWKGFCMKINCSQMKLLNFENWTNGEPQ